MTDYHKSWIQTFTKKKFFPLDPIITSIEIEDIAHALSMQCRFGGHCKHFYSVAQHSVYVSMVVKPELALQALLHDASEAYLVDIPKPLKVTDAFEKYREFEANLSKMIFRKFKCDEEEHADVKVADYRMLATESKDLMYPNHPDWKINCEPYNFKIKEMGPGEAKQLFLNRFYELERK